MNPEIKARWTAALRDPEAKQGRKALGRPDGTRCCLGVLCDLAVQDGVIDPPTTSGFGQSAVLRYGQGNGQPGTTGYLPTALMTWSGAEGLDQTTLIELNDGGGDVAARSFAEIADWIDDHV